VFTKLFLLFQIRSTYQLAHERLSVRTDAGTSTKSSLFHTWTRDTRDHPTLGTRGVRTRLRQELAGLGGGVTFYKAEADLHASRVLHPGLVCYIFLEPFLPVDTQP
jgi:outer membrane protein assembly factor BamA